VGKPASGPRLVHPGRGPAAPPLTWRAAHNFPSGDLDAATRKCKRCPHPSVDLVRHSAEDAATASGSEGGALFTLASHSEVMVPIALDQIIEPEAKQLTHASSRVGKNPDDQLVALVPRYVLDCLDLLATQHIEDSLRPSRHLPFGLCLDFTLSTQPAQPPVHRLHEGSYREAAERTSLAAMLQEVGAEPVQDPAGDLRRLRDPLLRRPGQEDSLERVSVVVANRLGR
jgi:hypothetical protein